MLTVCLAGLGKNAKGQSPETMMRRAGGWVAWVFVAGLAGMAGMVDLHAQSSLNTVRVGQGVIMVGDSEAKLSRLEQPQRRVQTFNRLGAPVGHRYEYRAGGRTVHVEVSGGRVVAAYIVSDS